MDSITYLKDCAGILPLLILTATAVIVLLMDAFSPKEHKGKLAWLSLGGIGAALVSLTLPLPARHELFGQMLFADDFTVFFHAVLLSAAALVVLLSVDSLKHGNIDFGEYYALLLFSTAGMLLMAQAANLIMLFLGLEILSIAIYILVGLPRHEKAANEASLKYFLLGAFASGFFLYGLTFIYGATGSLTLTSIAGCAASTREFLSNPYLLAGSALVLVGFSFKLALVPFHMWTPDAYEGAPTPVTAFMSVAVKAAVFAGLARVFWMGLPTLQPMWIPALWVLSAITMTVGNVAALTQSNIKRMLAYSSIAHAGYILIGLVAGTDSGLSSVLIYLLAYTFMNVGAFGVVVALQTRFGIGENIDDFKGLGFRYQLAGAGMAVFLFSLAGIPPTAGFVAKFFVFSAAIKSGFTGLVIVGVVNSAISVYYYLRPVIAMYTRVEANDGQPAPLALPVGTAGALIAAVWATFHIGIFPATIWEIAKRSVAVLL